MTYDDHEDCDKEIEQQGDKIVALEAENKRLREAMEKIKTNSYPCLAVKESVLLNRIYRESTQALKGP